MDDTYPCTALHAPRFGQGSRTLTCARTGEKLAEEDVERNASAIASGLCRLGLAAGDVVAFEPPDGLALYTLIAACAALGLDLLLRERGAACRLQSAKGARAPKLVLCTDPEESSRHEHAMTLAELDRFGRANAVRSARCRSVAWTIRPLRTPLTLLGVPPAVEAKPGEVVAHMTTEPARGSAVEIRTGDIGWLTPSGDLVIEGKLSEVAVRGGQAILLSDIDTLWRSMPGVRSSLTFRERGAAPTERVISAVAADLDDATLRAALAQRVEAHWLPDMVVTLPELPLSAGRDAVGVIRAAVNGQSASAAVDVLTSRRFRRSACYRQADLHALLQSAIMRRQPVKFLKFWGCGPRSFAAAPDAIALEALADLAQAVENAAPVQAQIDIMFTDGHADNNGHSAAHARSYFASVQRAAAKLNATFHLESEIWRRVGLSREMVCALEQTPEFAAKWDAFRLRDRFILQASRHSQMSDQVAAARHYYATCLLEREVLKAQFADSAFLTYNGPEFNECFPDLPTLYIYPGPRGRTDKPWFVHHGNDDFAPLSTGLAVAAE